MSCRQFRSRAETGGGPEHAPAVTANTAPSATAASPGRSLSVARCPDAPRDSQPTTTVLDPRRAGRKRAAQAVLARPVRIVPAGPAVAFLYPVPAHRWTSSGFPAAAAALRSPLVR